MTNQMKMILWMENIKKYSEGNMKIYQIGKSMNPLNQFAFFYDLLYCYLQEDIQLQEQLNF